jgi:CRISPR-associated endonuclease/helicase Cas3
MVYLAHTANESGQVHLLKDHLYDVGALAEKFIIEANPALAETSRWAGLLHDLGKYRAEFQQMLTGQTGKSVETHHAVYGAALACLQGWNLIAFAIAGHHAGLHNLGKLQELIKKPDYRILTSDILKTLQERFESEKDLPKIPQTVGNVEFIKDEFQFEFAARMIFSALIDADRLDTAEHANGEKFPDSPKLNAAGLLAKLLEAREDKRRETSNSDQKLVEIRNRIFDDCLRKAEEEKGFFSLTVPTGGGKTLSAMAFALRHAEVHRLRRVIVVIPYLSIIEQNAKQYRDIFGRDAIIENHSAVEIEQKPDDDDDTNPTTFITENWDAPVIVTTSVQFIESLFANKPSKCRKLHNIANSVVIFDEIQTLPAKLLEPLFSVWRELKENYGVSFVFSTATQPAFRKQNNFKNGFDEKTELREITTETEQIYKDLNRVSYDFANLTKPQTWTEIAAEMLAENQILCVVNTRRHAFELWNEIIEDFKLQNNIVGNLADPRRHGFYHLSSAMCPAHRLQTIEEIKERLKKGEACRVVSTQLVEAGVDLDFPVLFRAVAPLDSIVQAAGRCNREGKSAKGRVKIFQPADNVLPRGIYKNATEITAAMNLDEETLATDYEIFARYFRRLYQSNETGHDIQLDRCEFRFQEVAKKAKVIENEGVGVIVPFGKAVEIIGEIRGRGINLNKNTNFADFKKDDFRRLQRFMVNLHSQDFEKLNHLNQLEKLIPNKDLEVYVLNEASYHAELGVLKEERPANEILMV